MRRVLTLTLILFTASIIPLLAIPEAEAETLANAGTVLEIDSRTIGMWETYDGLTLIVNETGEVTAYNFKEDGTFNQAWNYSLNTSINAGALDIVQHRLALATDSGVEVISTEFRSWLYSITVNSGVDAVAWDGQGDLWVSDRSQRYAIEYDDNVATGVTTQSHLIKITAALGMPDGRVVTGGRDLVVRVSWANGTIETDLMDIASDVVGLYLIQNESTLLAVSDNGQMVFYSTTDWQKTGDIYLDSGGIIRSVKENSDGDLIVGTHNGHMKVIGGENLNEKDSFSQLGEIVGVKLVGQSAFWILASYSDKSEVVMFDLDSDSDGVVDALDAFPADPTQQHDRDGDGWGDNPLGNNPDRYPDEESQWVDSDGDGRGDNASGANGDLFPDNPDQYQDSDGDNYGDNPLGLNGDHFPDDASQWLDSDGDGLGDNPDGTDPDDCPTSPGTSYEDRDGCPDSDKDGFSNPRAEEIPCSATNPDGPDAYPQDATQWCDTDEDNYGDNLSGNNPDWCPAEWGNSTRGIYFDSELNKYVTIQRFGCVDNDGDGYEDSGEKDGLTDWSTNKTEWVDSDRDGVGDNADWDDLDPNVATLEKYCIKYPEDYNNCEVVYDATGSEDPSSDMTASEKRMQLLKEFVIYGGGIGVGLIAGILLLWGLVGFVRSAIEKRSPDAQYTHRDAMKEVNAWEEGEEFTPRGGITDEKGWEGEKLGDGVTEEQLWDLAEEIATPSAVPDSTMFSEADDSEPAAATSPPATSAAAATVVEPATGAIAEPEPVAEAEPAAPAPLPAPEPAPTSTPAPMTELPAGAPPLPEGGLPAGWTMEQWAYYGGQWWEAKNRQ